MRTFVNTIGTTLVSKKQMTKMGEARNERIQF